MERLAIVRWVGGWVGGCRSKGNDFRHHAKKSEKQQRLFAASERRDDISPHGFRFSPGGAPKQLCTVTGSCSLG